MANRTVTLPTIDHGPVTLPEPSWCTGHAHHDPESTRADLAHTGPDIVLAFRGRHIAAAALDHAPFAETAPRDVRVSVDLIGRTLDARGVYELAAALDTYADRLRTLADSLLVIAAEGDL
ncbi:DUF6907 domain-containing protein [Streptomyces viridosporus]|uniref:DUF6907 domain-containing protein n=1 Tax=Streptomyces viridosporus TaxID=67581 RepID=UPI0036FDB520